MRSYFNFFLLSAFIVATVVSPASAIIRRHDRDDQRYLELGATCSALTRLGGGTATLIAPHWLITAGHVTASLTPFDRSVEFNGKSYSIDGVVTHPNWRSQSGPRSMDIALVRLKQPVKGVDPARIYTEVDEKDREVVFVGPGRTGDGLTGPTTEDGKWRGATNTVERTMANWIVFSFDAPPNGSDLEGISGPGDSGGPALLELDGQIFVIGISSANDDSGADGPCRYGSTEYYARVSTAAEWIRVAMESKLPARELLRDVVDLTTAAWPTERPAQVATAFFKAYSNGDDASMEQFETAYRAEDALKERSVAERLQSWREYRDEWGELRASKCVAGSEDDIYVLVKAEGEAVWKTFRFMLQAEKPHRLIGIEIASPTRGDE